METQEDSGLAVEYPPASASDLATMAPQVTYSRASGSVFPVGTTPVEASTTDAAGNRASCSFHVTVKPAASPSEERSGCSAAGGSPAGLLGALVLLAWSALGRPRARRG